jgi:hypothetical protein
MTSVRDEQLGQRHRSEAARRQLGHKLGHGVQGYLTSGRRAVRPPRQPIVWIHDRAGLQAAENEVDNAVGGRLRRSIARVN